MAAERLQKVLARAGVASRRQVEEWIEAGRVSVNGSVAELGQRADLEVDAVRVDGKRIHPRRRPPVYLVINKPRGVVSTLNDPEGRRSILDLVPERYHRGLFTVGRLDWDSEGILLLTDDGDFAQAVAHPRHGCVKTYEVKVKESPRESDLERLRGGIVIDGRPCAPSDIEPFRGPGGARETSANTWWRVRLTEGRTRQIREMFQRIGNPVQRLRRVAIGSFMAPGLPRGSWRELTADEVMRLRDTSSEKQPRGAKGLRGRDSKGRPRADGKPRAEKKARSDNSRSDKKGPRSRSTGAKSENSRPGKGRPRRGRRGDGPDSRGGPSRSGRGRGRGRR